MISSAIDDIMEKICWLSIMMLKNAGAHMIMNDIWRVRIHIHPMSYHQLESCIAIPINIGPTIRMNILTITISVDATYYSKFRR